MKLIFFLAFSTCIVGCGNFFRDKSPAGPDLISSTKASVDFAEVKNRVLTPHCLTCHSNYANFVSVKSSATAILSAVEQDRMPKNAPPLPEDLKNLLRTWVAEGANEFLDSALGETMPEEEVSGLVPTWSSLSVRIFEPKCLVCHSPGGQAPWVDFSSRAAMAKTLIKHINFKNPEESNLIVRLTDPEEPMPPPPPQSNITQLTLEEVQVVIEWINAGLP